MQMQMTYKTEPFQFHSEVYLQHFYVEMQSETTDDISLSNKTDAFISDAKNMMILMHFPCETNLNLNLMLHTDNKNKRIKESF